MVKPRIVFLLIGLALGFFVLPMVQGMLIGAPNAG